MAQALDSNRSIAQYLRDQWSSEQGFSGGSINAISESDGYLWIGGEKGLVQFDGLTFRLVNHANTADLPAGRVLGLSSDAQGDLLIRLQSPDLRRYRGGVFETVLPMMGESSGVMAMGRGLNGDVLLARPGSFLRYSHGTLTPILPLTTQPPGLVISIAETTDGAIWLGTRDLGLFSLHDKLLFTPPGLPDPKVNCLLPGDGPELWVGTDTGLIRWDGTKLTRGGVPPALSSIQVLAMIRDRDSNVWVGTTSGLARIDTHGVISLEPRFGQRTEAVSVLYEDREGNLWVGRPHGIERYRDRVFFTYSVLTGQPLGEGGPLYVDAAGRTWFGPASGGLVWLRDTEDGRITAAGLSNDVVYSIDGAPGELWIGRQRGGLTHLRHRTGSLSAETFTVRDGLAPGSVYTVHRNRDGTVWAGTLGGGASRIHNGTLTTYTTASGLASNTISAIEEGVDGTMWLATPNGLNAFTQGQWRIYTSQDGLPPGAVNCLTEDRDGVLWIGTDAGLVFIRGGRVEIPRDLSDTLLDEVLGIAGDGRGSLWIATSKHVVRVSRAQLLGEKSGRPEVREFGPADGLTAIAGVRRSRLVTTDRLGRIWFALEGALAVAEPAPLMNQSVPAIVHIQSVSADGSLETLSPLRIPSGRRRVTFSYIGLSLSVPERVRFRYRLDPYDHDWSEPVTAREAPYTNLGPGQYRFRVIASNSEGDWNSAEAAIAMEVMPALWQTWWFRLCVFATCVLGILAVYRLRLRQLTQQLNLRFEERLAERTRIAQDLHDTLLQGLLSASMQLHVAAEGVPADLPAKPQLQRVLELMQRVVDEGRNAVRGLRISGGNIDDLGAALSKIRDEQLLPQSAEFRVIVQGHGHALSPLIRDEVYGIGREALLNAFRHSGAATIELELDYDPRQFRLLVRDSGCGIDPEVLDSGRQDHWGMVGMRERAEHMGAQLKVWSRAAAGTEVELTVPAHIAFATAESGALRRWLSRLWPRRPMRLPQ